MKNKLLILLPTLVLGMGMFVGESLAGGGKKETSKFYITTEPKKLQVAPLPQVQPLSPIQPPETLAPPAPPPASGTSPPVSSFAMKSVVALEAGNKVEAKFNFESEVPQSMSPDVNVVTTASGVSGDASVGACEFNPERTAYICSVDGLKGCTDPTDYTLNLSGAGFTSFTSVINSADDEFDWPSGVSVEDMISNRGDKCWIGGWQFGEVAVLPTLSTFRVRFPANNIHGICDLVKNFVGDFALGVYIRTNTSPADGGIGRISIYMDTTFPSNSGMIFSSGKVVDDDDRWQIGYWDLARGINAIAVPERTGKFGPIATHTAPFYVCMVKHQGQTKVYITAESGGPYEQIVDRELSCYRGYGNCSNPREIFNQDVSSWEETHVRIRFEEYTDSDWLSEIGWVRFRNTGLQGTAADCPRLD